MFTKSIMALTTGLLTLQAERNSKASKEGLKMSFRMMKKEQTVVETLTYHFRL